VPANAAEVIVGAPWDSRSSSYSSAYSGAISVFDGRDLEGTLTTSDADLTVYGEHGGAWLGWSVSAVDADGDGYDDLLAAAPGDDEGGPGAGTLYVLSGAAHLDWGSHIEAASSARLFGTSRSGYLGLWGVGSVGDADGDGALDWLIGLPSTGMVALATDLGAMSGPHAIEDTPGLWWFPSGDCGSAVEATTDLDGDEVDDILVGCPGDDTHGQDAGLVYRLDGRSSSERDTSDALATIYGEAAGDSLGSEILGRSDVDGDGRADALLGAPGNDGGGEDAGADYLLTGFGGSAP
jgi:hypothetical protein